MWFYMAFLMIISWIMIDHIHGISSPLTPFSNYTNSIILQNNISDLWWKIDFDKQEIIFELHIKTTGWIALGISPAGGMTGADIGVGWVDQTGQVHFQDRYAYGFLKPVLDNTTTDWFALKGREQDGWTAIQFKRLLDTCDSMDVNIKSGTNILIFAYGLVDPDPSQSNGDITYHENRRGTRIIPLLSYVSPPSKDKFSGLRTFEFRVSNFSVPPDNSNYYCEIFKVPNDYPNKNHVIAREILIDSGNEDILHHLILGECDPSVTFDDNNLPRGFCNIDSYRYDRCVNNIAMGWAIGGDSMLEYPEEAGFPIGLNFSVKYYGLQVHFNNKLLTSNRIDRSGIRFYVGNKLREHDIGLLTFGPDSSPYGLVIPPKMNEFSVNSYCLANTSLTNFPETGLTVIGAFPHTHLQGKKVWTKLIRNKTAVEYLFNAEAYDFNYQFQYIFQKPIQIYPNDEFATQCVYNTLNKNITTLGGSLTTDEMCFHYFTYYPRMKDLYFCMTIIDPSSWQFVLNSTLSSIQDSTIFTNLLQNINWTPDSANQWQKFYNNASYVEIYGQAGLQYMSTIPKLPEYRDVNNITECKPKTANANHQTILFLFVFIPFFICKIII